MNEAVGHGVNQRKMIEMTPEEVEAFLGERRAMSMCSLSRDGSIHAIAMWYGFLDGCVTVETKAKSQKVQNLRRTPASLASSRRVTIRAAPWRRARRPGGDRRGSGQAVTLGVSVFERYNGAYSEELKPIVEMMLHKRVAIKLIVERTVSWDHRRLGLPSSARAGMRISISQAVSVPSAHAIAAYGSPAFYPGRPERDDISVLEVVRHDDAGERVLLEVRFAFPGSVRPRSAP